MEEDFSNVLCKFQDILKEKNIDINSVLGSSSNPDNNNTNNENHSNSFDFDINTILEKISNSNAQGIIDPNLNQIQLTNTKIYSKGGVSEGIKARLSKALHEAHEKKIHASIPMDLLKNLSAK